MSKRVTNQQKRKLANKIHSKLVQYGSTVEYVAIKETVGCDKHWHQGVQCEVQAYAPDSIVAWGSAKTLSEAINNFWEDYHNRSKYSN
jgi:hypothetical protein